MKLSIVIPCFNEAHIVETVVRELCQALESAESSFEIIVVDNGSFDDTPALLEELKARIPQLKAIRIFPNKGYGNGILAGLAIAKGEIVGWMDGDGQCSAQDLVKVYETLRSANASFCKATRVRRGDNRMRIAQSKLYNALFRFMFHNRCQDVNAKPKLFQRQLLKKLDLQSRDWFIDAEIIIKASRLGYPICEVPIAWRERTGGSSKVNIKTSFEFLRNMILYYLCK